MFASFDKSIRSQARNLARTLRPWGFSTLAIMTTLGAIQLAVLCQLFVQVWIVDQASMGLSQALSLTAIYGGYLICMAMTARRLHVCLTAKPVDRRVAIVRFVKARRSGEMFGRLFSVFIALGALSAFPDFMAADPGLHVQAGPMLALTVIDAARQYWFC